MFSLKGELPIWKGLTLEGRPTNPMP